MFAFSALFAMFVQVYVIPDGTAFFVNFVFLGEGCGGLCWGESGPCDVGSSYRGYFVPFRGVASLLRGCAATVVGARRG